MKTKKVIVENKKPDFKNYAPSGWIFIVVGDSVWGRGKTIQAAYNAAMKPKYYIVMEAVDGAFINQMGRIYISRDTPMEQALFDTATKHHKYWYKVIYEKLPKEEK